VSGDDGSFLFNNLLDSGNYTLIITSVGYDRIDKEVLIDVSNKDLGIINFQKQQGTELTGVTVTAKTPPVQQKQIPFNTMQVNIKLIPMHPPKTSLLKMPGITVDKNGTATAQGDQVKSVTVDGKKFFGDDATTALRNLPAEIIDKIQVFDKLSDQAAFTVLMMATAFVQLIS